MVWPFGKQRKPRCDVGMWAKIIAAKEREAAELKLEREQAQAELLALFSELTVWKGKENAPDD